MHESLCVIPILMPLPHSALNYICCITLLCAEAVMNLFKILYIYTLYFYLYGCFILILYLKFILARMLHSYTLYLCIIPMLYAYTLYLCFIRVLCTYAFYLYFMLMPFTYVLCLYFIVILYTYTCFNFSAMSAARDSHSWPGTASVDIRRAGKSARG